MTIAQAFNEITIAQGGTPNGGGTITGAIDALNDTLAGSDQVQGRTIEDAVRLLGQHIGGGSSVTVEALTATENDTYTAPEGKAYSPVTVNVAGGTSFGDLKYITCTTGGEPYEVDGLALSSATIAINTIIASVNSGGFGEFIVAAGAYLGIQVMNYESEDAYLTVDDGEPQHIDKVLSPVDDFYYHVFQVPDAESIAVSVG